LLTNIKIKNFKSLKDIHIVLGQITILIGLNGSGKSSLLQALSVMKQSLKQSQPMVDGDLLNLGYFNDVVSEGETKISFFIGGQKEVIFTPFVKRRRLAEYGYEIVCDRDGLFSLDPVIKINDYTISGRWHKRRSESSNRIELDTIYFQYGTSASIGMPFRIEASNVGTDENKYEEANAALNSLFGIFKDELDSVIIVPALRGFDKPRYNIESTIRRDIMDSLGTSQQASHLASAIAYQSEIEEKVSENINRITSIKIRHKLVPDKQIQIETHKKINIINEGFGTNQLVQLFTQIESASPYSLIAIEEPEIHLHPKAQAETAQVLMEIAQNENKNLLISTHSEHLLFRFLINVAKKKLDPKKLNIYYFELENGFTKITKLEVDEKGRLSGGLKGFFETDLDEFAQFLGA
jgi:predicted ATPase